MLTPLTTVARLAIHAWSPMYTGSRIASNSGLAGSCFPAMIWVSLAITTLSPMQMPDRASNRTRNPMEHASPIRI